MVPLQVIESRSSRKSTEPEWLPAPTRENTARKRTITVPLRVPQTIVQVCPVPCERSPPGLTDRLLTPPPTPFVYYSGEPQLDAEWPSLPSRKHANGRSDRLFHRGVVPHPHHELHPLQPHLMMISWFWQNYSSNSTMRIPAYGESVKHLQASSNQYSRAQSARMSFL